MEKAAPIALGTARDFLQQHAEPMEVQFILFTEPDLQVYRQALADLG